VKEPSAALLARWLVSYISLNHRDLSGIDRRLRMYFGPGEVCTLKRERERVDSLTGERQRRMQRAS